MGAVGKGVTWALEGGRALRESGALIPPNFLSWTGTGPFLGLHFFLGPKEVRLTNHGRKTGLGTSSFLGLP